MSNRDRAGADHSRPPRHAGRTWRRSTPGSSSTGPTRTPRTSSINYYPKGAVIAFLLDAKIRKATSGARSLDTGMQFAMQRYSGDKGYTTEQFYAVMSEAAGTNLKSLVREDGGVDRRARLHRGARLLRPPVPSGRHEHTRAPYIGGGTRNDAGRLIVSRRCDAAHPASTPA